MWKRILEPLRKKLKGENGVRLVMLLGIAGLALILLSGFLPDKAEKQTDAASVQSAETASQEQAEQYCRRMEQQLVDVLEQKLDEIFAGDGHGVLVLHDQADLAHDHRSCG